MENLDPLISCICITSNRPLLLQRALACFERQTYKNKELVLSYPKSDLLTKNVVEQISAISDMSLVILERPDDESLGTARNQAIEASNGEYICIWDDDDWYHDNRIKHQYNPIKNGNFKASIFLNILLYDFESKETYFGPTRMWEGSLLCEKTTLSKHLYLDKEKGEDTAVAFNLYISNMLYNITDAPFMYVYIYHGNNTWGESHFNSYFLQSQPLDEHINQQIEDLTSLEYYQL